MLTSRVRRLASMSRAEILERSRQAVAKRLDEVCYRVGSDFSQGKIKPTSENREFFFTTEQVPSLISLLATRFPEQSKKIVSSAERLLQHRFDLLGYEDCNYGREIAWHSDIVHGKRAPLKPWYKIRYLDFNEVGDGKITWELNRHQHFLTLAKAYRITGDERFAKEIFMQWGDWHRHNPYPIGINWASSLEVAFRSMSWIWTYFLLDSTPAMPKNFRGELLAALAVGGRHIERYLSTYFSPNTHLLGEGVGLFFIGTLFPQLKMSDRWKRRGWEIVLRAAKQHVQSDGFYFEQSTYYHVYALDLFLHAAVLASGNDIPVPDEFDRTLEKMLAILCRLSDRGPAPRLGDDDGGRVFDAWRNRAEHMRDPLATGAVLFGRGDFKLLADGPREETMWLLGQQGLAEFDRLPAKQFARGAGLTPKELDCSGLYVMDHPEANQQLIIDAGPQGSLAAGHGHADALSVTINSDGRALLIDSGTFEYVGNGEGRNSFRGTSAHNTLTVDGLSQAEPRGPFSWGKLPQVKAERWIEGHKFDLFVGSHDGYKRLPNPVTHRRQVFSLKSRFWLIRDVATGEGKHQLDLFWHLSPEFSPREKSGGFFEDFLSLTGGPGLRLSHAENHDWTRRTVSADWSPIYGRKEKHSVVQFNTLATLPAEFATLLLPLAAGDRNDSGTLDRVERSSKVESAKPQPVQEYVYEQDGEVHRLFFGQGQPWEQSGWRSDAEFLYFSESSGRQTRMLICCDFTFVDAHGESIIAQAHRASQCEIIITGERVDIFPPERKTRVNEKALRNMTSRETVLTTSDKSGVKAAAKISFPQGTRS